MIKKLNPVNESCIGHKVLVILDNGEQHTDILTGIINDGQKIKYNCEKYHNVFNVERYRNIMYLDELRSFMGRDEDD